MGENSTEVLWLELIHVVIASSFVEVKRCEGSTLDWGFRKSPSPCLCLSIPIYPSITPWIEDDGISQGGGFSLGLWG